MWDILTQEEMDNWMSQIVISNSEKMGFRKKPVVFSEHGIAMLSSILNSKTAIAVNIQIIRTFTRMRQMILTNQEILSKLDQIEKQSLKNKKDIQLVFNYLKKLLIPADQKNRKPIGYKRKLNNK